MIIFSSPYLTGAGKNQWKFHVSNGRNVFGNEASSTISLPAFGLATYKLRGSILTPSGAKECQQVNFLLGLLRFGSSNCMLIFLISGSSLPTIYNEVDRGLCLNVFHAGIQLKLSLLEWDMINYECIGLKVLPSTNLFSMLSSLKQGKFLFRIRSRTIHRTLEEEK